MALAATFAGHVEEPGVECEAQLDGEFWDDIFAAEPDGEECATRLLRGIVKRKADAAERKALLESGKSLLMMHFGLQDGPGRPPKHPQPGGEGAVPTKKKKKRRLGLSKRVREMVLAEGDGASELAKGDGASEDSDDVPISVLLKAKPTGAGDAAAPRKLRKAAA